ncbi:hypothetical protein TNCV_937301 [Trichonephila clavipes]|nr:hypothetical protein TNCV_937301 [Trichonephila clavipes]
MTIVPKRTSKSADLPAYPEGTVKWRESTELLIPVLTKLSIDDPTKWDHIQNNQVKPRDRYNLRRVGNHEKEDPKLTSFSSRFSEEFYSPGREMERF